MSDYHVQLLTKSTPLFLPNIPRAAFTVPPLRFDVVATWDGASTVVSFDKTTFADKREKLNKIGNFSDERIVLPLPTSASNGVVKVAALRLWAKKMVATAEFDMDYHLLRGPCGDSKGPNGRPMAERVFQVRARLVFTFEYNIKRVLVKRDKGKWVPNGEEETGFTEHTYEGDYSFPPRPFTGLRLPCREIDANQRFDDWFDYGIKVVTLFPWPAGQ